MCFCINCNKEFESADINALGMCDNCFFELNFKSPEKIRESLADDLEEEGEMLLESDDLKLKKVGEKLKMYAMVVEKL